MGSDNSSEQDGKRMGLAVLIITILLVLALIISLSSVVYYFFLVSSASDLSGEAILKGTYFNSNDRTVEGVLVRVEGTDISAYTDEKGDYELAGVPAGEQTIVFERGGYPTIRVTQLVIPEEQLKRYEMKNNYLDITDIIVGGVLVDKPIHSYRVEENILAKASLTAKFAENVTLKNATVSVYNTTEITQVSEDGEFNMSGLAPGLLLLNVTVTDETSHAVVFLREGKNNVTFERDIDIFVDRSLFPLTANEELPTKDIGLSVLDINDQTAPGATLFIRPLAYNPVNRTILEGIPPFKDALGSSIIQYSGNEKLSLINGHVYQIEIATPGYESVYLINMTYNGTEPLMAVSDTTISPLNYHYSLAGFKIVIVFQIIMSLLIGFGLKAAISRGKFGRVMTGCIAAFISSASVPLALLIMPVAHNWILGIAAFVLLLINKNKFSK